MEVPISEGTDAKLNVTAFELIESIVHLKSTTVIYQIQGPP